MICQCHLVLLNFDVKWKKNKNTGWKSVNTVDDFIYECHIDGYGNKIVDIFL